MSKELTAKEKELFDNIRKSLCLFYNFGYNIENDDDDDVYNAISDTLKKYSLQYEKGVSKMCLISKEANWVIKVPFRGEYYHDYDEDEDFFESWCGGGGDYSDDYCALEVYYYEKAQEAGIAELFAEPRYFGRIEEGHLPCYIQEKCTTYNWKEECSNFRAPSEDSLKKIRSSREEDYRKYCRFSDDWLALVLDIYGQEKLDKLFDFLNDNPDMADDFHGGNYGYREEDGTPVLIDFTGWNN